MNRGFQEFEIGLGLIEMPHTEPCADWPGEKQSAGSALRSSTSSFSCLKAYPAHKVQNKTH